MLIITGACGFIGSNLIAFLNSLGFNDILAVDNLANGTKVLNISDLDIADYVDRNDLIPFLEAKSSLSHISSIIHLGASSATTEWDGYYLMKNNYEYTKNLFHLADSNNIRFIYASSASVYGRGDRGFIEDSTRCIPINAYAYSKHLFDQYLLRLNSLHPVNASGLRFFNVYGPRESHKQAMASTIYHFHNQLLSTGKVKLFSGSHGYADGEQQRDFVHVIDCAKVIYWMIHNHSAVGIFNVGTGIARSFNDVAKNVITYHSRDTSAISYVPFPTKLIDSYQAYTQADISKLRKAGYLDPFLGLEEGVKEYLSSL